MSKMIYLACPYTHADPTVMHARYEYVTQVAARLVRRGHIVFSPITHGHPMNQLDGTPAIWEFWEAQDKAFIERSQELWVVGIEGWEISKGVNAEIAIARELNIPTCLLTPTCLFDIFTSETTPFYLETIL